MVKQPCTRTPLNAASMAKAKGQNFNIETLTLFINNILGIKSYQKGNWKERNLPYLFVHKNHSTVIKNNTT